MNALLFSPVQIRIAAALCVSLLLASCATTRPAQKAAATPVASVQPEQPKALSPPAATLAKPPSAGSALPPVRSQSEPVQSAPVQQEAPVSTTSMPAYQPAPIPRPAPMPAAVKAPAPVPTPTPPKPAPIPATTPAPVVSAAKPAPSPAPIKPEPATQVPASKTLANKVEAPQPGKPQAEPSKPSPKPKPSQPEVAKPEPAPATTAAAPVPTPVAPATVTVSLDNLPLSIQGQWTVDRNESRCTLQSATQRMDDGQGGTRASLWLTANELTVQTESDIDLSYSGTGISIDSGRHFALESVQRRTNIAFSKQRSALLAAMKSGQTLELTLGFWPTWPVTQTYSARFPLQHFASAYAAWETCNTLLNQR